MDELQKIVDDKKLKSSNTKPKYGARKLKVGLVSVLMGSMVLSPAVGSASEPLDLDNVGNNIIQDTNEADSDKLELSDLVISQVVNAVKGSTETNYADDEKKVGTYRDTQLTRGEGPSFTSTDSSMGFTDGFRYQTLEPSETSTDQTK